MKKRCFITKFPSNSDVVKGIAVSTGISLVVSTLSGSDSGVIISHVQYGFEYYLNVDNDNNAKTKIVIHLGNL